MLVLTQVSPWVRYSGAQLQEGGCDGYSYLVRKGRNVDQCNSDISCSSQQCAAVSEWRDPSASSSALDMSIESYFLPPYRNTTSYFLMANDLKNWCRSVFLSGVFHLTFCHIIIRLIFFSFWCLFLRVSKHVLAVSPLLLCSLKMFSWLIACFFISLTGYFTEEVF